VDPYAPAKEDRFSFGLWTVGNPGADPFGDAVRPPRDVAYLVRKLAERAVWGAERRARSPVGLDGMIGREKMRVSPERWWEYAERDLETARVPLRA